MIPFIQTRNGVTVFIDGDSHEVDQTNPQYQNVLDVLKSDLDPTDAAREILNLLTRALQAVKSAVAASPQSGVTFEDGVVKFNGVPLYNSITDRILRMVDEGFKVDPLVRFLEKLQQNPSFRVVNNLYDFLEAGSVPITEDGDFLAYKAIRKDWKDIHSGTIDNSVGQVVQISRNQVDEDPERTCSHGLHVCSWKYLPHFAHDDGRVVVVKVSPADVVAIPADYNNTKMRCSRYEVVSEYVDYYEKDPHNFLGDRSVFNTAQFQDENEELEAEFVDDNDDDAFYGYPLSRNTW